MRLNNKERFTSQTPQVFSSGPLPIEEGKTFKIIRSFTWPQSGLDCLVCAMFVNLKTCAGVCDASDERGAVHSYFPKSSLDIWARLCAFRRLGMDRRES